MIYLILNSSSNAIGKDVKPVCINSKSHADTEILISHLTVYHWLVKPIHLSRHYCILNNTCKYFDIKVW